MSSLFTVHSQGNIQLLELKLPMQMDVVDFDTLNESILSALAGKTSSPWVLDLSATDYMGSSVLGLMVNIRHQVRSDAGRLVLCGMSARLQQVFRACCMERLFTIVPTRDDALRTVKA